MKIDRIHVATIKASELTLKTSVLIEDNINESTLFFAVIILMYFKYKIYKNKSDFIENIIVGKKRWEDFNYNGYELKLVFNNDV